MDTRPFQPQDAANGASRDTGQSTDASPDAAIGDASITDARPMGDGTTDALPPLRVGQLQWSFDREIGGLSCLRISESADPDGWDNNYLCAPYNPGWSWGTAGPYPNRGHCLHIIEPDDPDTWDDNYLCMPSDLGWQWSSTGPIANLTCLQINEPANLDEGWGDNYLCGP